MNTTVTVFLVALVVVSFTAAHAVEIYTLHGGGSNLGTIDTVTGLGNDVGSFGLPGFPTVANSVALDLTIRERSTRM